MELEGQVAIVTGGTKGLGAAIADTLAAAGAIVVRASRSADPFLPPQSPPPAGCLLDAALDVTDPHAVRALFDAVVGSLRRLDLLVANAGVSHDAKLQYLPLANWNDMVQTNLSGVFHCLQAAIPQMRAQGSGTIITVSSSMATRPALGTATYSATKAAVEALTREAAVELGPRGIRAVCIAPGVLTEGMGRDLVANDTVWPEYLKRSALGRAGLTSEVARAALFLAGPRSSYINGTVIEVNGGLSWA